LPTSLRESYSVNAAIFLRGVLTFLLAQKKSKQKKTARDFRITRKTPGGRHP